MSAEISATLQKLGSLINDAEAARSRAVDESLKMLRLQNEVASLKDKLAVTERKLDAANEQVDRLRRDAIHWRKATRYEQVLKDRKGKAPRHLPTFNGVRRSSPSACWGQNVNRERVFLKHWRQENVRRPGTNGGRGALELILSENSNEWAADITQRDATVAASVVQWLGTNCGQAFLHEVQREIDAKRGKRGAS